MSPSTSRTELVAQLKGQVLQTPDLSTVFKHWPADLNPLLDEIRATVPPRIKSMTNSPKKQKVLTKIDGGLFSAYWWPMAELDRADVLSCLALWLFIWDDEIDTETGDLSLDFTAAQTFRQQTIEWIRHCLQLETSSTEIQQQAHSRSSRDWLPGLWMGIDALMNWLTRQPHAVSCDQQSEKPIREHVTPKNSIIASFKILGDAACQVYDLEHRKVLFNKLEAFIQASEVEQEIRLSPNLPTIREYIENRNQTSAVDIICLFIEYAYGIMLPASVLHDPEMSTIWSNTCRIVWLHNDLLSLKKEVNEQAVDSLIPLLLYELGSLSTAVESVMKMVEEAVRDMDAAEKVLLAKHRSNPGLQQDLKTYIDGCRRVCTGNLAWSLRTDRYKIRDQSTGAMLHVTL